MKPQEFWSLHPTEFWWLVDARRTARRYGSAGTTESEMADIYADLKAEGLI